MRALCYDPDASAGLRLAETAEPVPGAGCSPRSPIRPG